MRVFLSRGRIEKKKYGEIKSKGFQERVSMLEYLSLLFIMKAQSP